MTTFVIDYFELPADSVRSSARFFRDAFGWEERSYGPTYSEIMGAGVLGGLNGSPTGRSAGLVVGIRTDDLEAARTAVEQAGGTISIAAHDYPGGRRFFFREPGGAEFLVYQPAA